MPSDDPPLKAHELAAWFADAVHAEVTELERKGGDQRYELHTGQRVSPDQSRYAIYRFALADNTLVPEDASGTIDIKGQQFKASVVAYDTGRLDVQIDGAEALAASIARAILCIDDLGLLRKLIEVLEAVASGSEPVSPLATGIFHPKPDGVRKPSLPAMPALNGLEREQRAVLEQACASDVTFVWGPPGTGKTYVIARMIAALIARGERVLMTSHTHAAIDEAMYKTAGPDGPLIESTLVCDGKIVRIGRVPPNSKVPELVRIDSIVERRAEGIQSEIGELQHKAVPLAAMRAHLTTHLGEWERLSELRLLESEQYVNETTTFAWQKIEERNQASLYVEDCREQLGREQLGYDQAVHLDNIVERRTEGIQSEISELQHKAVALAAKRAHLNTHLGEWERLSDLRMRTLESEQYVNKATTFARQKIEERNQASLYVEDCREQLGYDQEWQPFDLFTSWLNVPVNRVARAREAVAAAERAHATISKVADEAVASAREAERVANSLRVEAKTQADACAGLPAAESLKQQLAPVNAELDQIERRLTELRGRLDALEREIIANARVVAATLTRVARAREALAAAERNHATISKVAERAVASAREAERAANSLQIESKTQANVCAGLPSAETLKLRLAPVNSQLDQIELRLTELRTLLDALEKEVIASARVVAATLTKCYVGDQLKDESFDAVIVDEISMALPPLLFVAARRALRRVILVGDFKQLPPIVRGDNKLSKQRLATDAFTLAGLIDKNLEPIGRAVMTQLCTQRRMLPAIADAARCISYGVTNLKDGSEVLQKAKEIVRDAKWQWLRFLPENPLIVVDSADLHFWCGRQAGSLSRFNLYSAQIAVELAAMAASGIRRPNGTDAPPVGIVTPYAAQSRLLWRLVQALHLEDWVKVGNIHTFQGGEAELIIFDAVLDEPYYTARLCNPQKEVPMAVKRDLNVALTRARSKFVFVGSSEWLNRHAKPTSGLGQLWHYLKDHADLVSALDLVEVGFAGRVADASSTYRVPVRSDASVHEILDENKFFDFFADDLRNASESIFGLVPFFGEYRWPRIEPLIREALARGVEVTLVTPPSSEADNRSYVERVIRSLRELGAVVVAATGLHGKDVVIDSRVHYTGSLNWASHRGRAEIMHRTENSEYARMVLEYLQARHIRTAAQQGNQPRTCPHCHGPTQVVNQARPMAQWDKQPMKVGCADYQNTGCRYLVKIDDRLPFLEPPRCSIDQQTKYRRVRRGRREVWECPKHPKECKRFKVVLGDP